MTLHDITRKLIGPIQPVGETNADKERLANLQETIRLADLLIGEINDAARNHTRPEASMKAIGIQAKAFMDDLKDSLS